MKFTSFLIGMSAGAALAVLLTPYSGEETREILSDTARQGRKFAEKNARQFQRVANEKVQQVREAASQRLDDLKEMAMDAADRGREVITRHKDALADAVQEAKSTYIRESQSA